MKKFISFLCILQSILVLFSTCQSDNLPDPKIRIIEVDGFVVDENGESITDAEIEFNNEKTNSDIDGYFQFPAKSNAGHVYVKIKKHGYFHGSRTLFLDNSGSTRLHIRLLKKTFSNEFHSASGAIINVDEKVKLEFTPNSILTNSGTIYNGPVLLAIQYLDPSDNFINEIMPGNLVGINAMGETRGLASYAMVVVEMQTPGGEVLIINPNHGVQIKLAIPLTMQSHAPAIIPLWHFDETQGLWKEEGFASKNDKFYEGIVKHFSFWNCDDPFPVIQLRGLVVRQEGNPVPYAEIKLTILSNNINTLGHANKEGIFEGLIPKNEELILEILNFCGKPLHKQNIGPFGANTDIGSIVLPFDNDIYLLNGKVVGTNNQGIPNLFINLFTGVKQNFSEKTDDAGLFSFEIPNCLNNELQLVMKNNCNKVLLIKNLKALTSDLDLGQIQIQYSNENSNISGQVINDSSTPIPGLAVQVNSLNYQGLSGITDDEGKFKIQLGDCLKENVRLTIQGTCNEFLYEKYWSEIKSSLDLGQIITPYKGKFNQSFNGQIVNNNNEGIPNLKVEFKGNNYSYFVTKTDTEGKFNINMQCCNVSTLAFTVSDYCEQIIENRQIKLDKPIIELGTIKQVTGSFEKATVEGKIVDCNYNSLEGISVIVNSGPKFYKTFTDKFGNYKMEVVFCNTDIITIKGYDIKTQVYTEILSYGLPGPIHVATLQLCKANIKSDEYFNYQFSDGAIGNHTFDLTHENSFGIYSIFTNTADPWFDLKWLGPGRVGGITLIKEISYRSGDHFYVGKYTDHPKATILFKTIPIVTGEFLEGTFEGVEIKKQDIRSGQTITTGLSVSGSFKIKKE